MVGMNCSTAVRFGGRAVIIDECNIHLLSQRDWYVNQRYLREKCPGSALIHRLVLQAPEGMVVDHINGNGLDNRVANLRLCSQTENKRNRKTHANNALGVKGVHIIRRKNNVLRYRAQLTFEGKKIDLGTYSSIDTAARAYERGAIKYFGEYARIESTRIPI